MTKSLVLLSSICTHIFEGDVKPKEVKPLEIENFFVEGVNESGFSLRGVRSLLKPFPSKKNKIQKCAYR